MSSRRETEENRTWCRFTAGRNEFGGDILKKKSCGA